MAIRHSPQRGIKLMLLAAVGMFTLAGCATLPPCQDEQCVETRREVILQLMRNQQATCETQMRTMYQPIQAPHTSHCFIMPMGNFAQMNCN